MSRWVESRQALPALLLVAGAAVAGEPMRFDFEKHGNVADHPAYDAARGFGFEPSATGAHERFSIKVPEGNYRVHLKLSRQRRSASFIALAEQRRVMDAGSLHGVLETSQKEMTFVVNVRTPELPALPENATGGTRVALKPREVGSLNWDDKLTVDLGPRASVSAIVVEPVSVPTLYLAGDSTVTDQPREPDGSWGQFLPAFFGEGMAVANHAESGESLKSFVSELRLAKLLSNLREGDWVMIQFGHNDQKRQWPQTYADAASTYPAWLRTYIAEVRRHGATPILVTSPERRNFDDQGRITPTLAEYAAAVRAVAQEQRVAWIDLNAMSIRFYEALGPEKCRKAFADDGRDLTHHNEYGAEMLARYVIEELRSSPAALTKGLERHLRPGIPRFDPSRPPRPGTMKASIVSSIIVLNEAAP